MARPSGEQFEIAFEDQLVVVVEVGAGLRTYSVDGRDVIDGYGVEEMSEAGRGQVLAPWPNRLEDGSYEFRGRRHQLPLTEPENSNAIHGLVRWAAWQVRDHERRRVLLEHFVHPQPGYPFCSGSSSSTSSPQTASRFVRRRRTKELIPVRMAPGGIRTSGRARQQSTRLFCGFPPEPFSLRTSGAFRSAPRRWRGRNSISGSLGSMGDVQLDHCFTDLERDDDGRVRVALASPDDDTVLSLWADDAYQYVMVYSGDSRRM